MQGPMKGIRVLDLTNVLAGPFCCHQLVHMGAEVIKVEAPGGGDLARELGLDAALNARGMGISFLAQNVGKRSICLNLKTEGGKDVLRRLVAASDVLVENFRPGVMERLELGYEVLKAENPALIYCAISGFGQTGPWAGRPAYDQIVQGAAGVMSVTGDAESAPLRVGYPVSDTMGGMTAAFAIAAALNAPERGMFIDVSMLSATLASMGWAVSNYLIGGVAPTPHGNENYTSAPSGAFATGRGLINIAANRQVQWEALAACLGHPEWCRDPRFVTREDRKAHRPELKACIEAALQGRSAEDWAEELNGAGVPAGAIMTVPEILAHPQVAAQDLVTEYPSAPGVDRPITVVATGFQMDGKTPHAPAPPPELGADTEDILREVLGLDDRDLAELRVGGAI